eukprot:7824306-Lingulodinium_polyedra.AAC.1
MARGEVELPKLGMGGGLFRAACCGRSSPTTRRPETGGLCGFRRGAPRHAPREGPGQTHGEAG